MRTHHPDLYTPHTPPAGARPVAEGGGLMLMPTALTWEVLRDHVAALGCTEPGATAHRLAALTAGVLRDRYGRDVELDCYGDVGLPGEVYVTAGIDVEEAWHAVLDALADAVLAVLALQRLPAPERLTWEHHRELWRRSEQTLRDRIEG